MSLYFTISQICLQPLFLILPFFFFLSFFFLDNHINASSFVNVVKSTLLLYCTALRTQFHHCRRLGLPFLDVWLWLGLGPFRKTLVWNYLQVWKEKWAHDTIFISLDEVQQEREGPALSWRNGERKKERERMGGEEKSRDENKMKRNSINSGRTEWRHRLVGRLAWVRSVRYHIRKGMKRIRRESLTRLFGQRRSPCLLSTGLFFLSRVRSVVNMDTQLNGMTGLWMGYPTDQQAKEKEWETRLRVFLTDFYDVL